MHSTFIAFATLTLLSQGHAQQQHTSLMDRYHPVPGAARIPVETCQQSQPAPDQTIMACSQVRVVRTVATQNDPNAIPEIVLEMPRGIQLKVKLESYSIFPGTAYQTDLNGDHRTDLVLAMPWSGTSMQGEPSQVVFALSDGEGYRVSAIDTISFAPSALVRVGGQPRVLHSAFVNTRATDGRDHSFFVYSFLNVAQGQLQLDSSHPRVWIQFKNQPNTTPTRLLTEKQKQQAWNAYLKWTTEDHRMNGIFRKAEVE